MSRTDKTDPYWVKARRYGRVVHWCALNRRYGAAFPCDFQEGRPERRQMCDYRLDSFEMQRAWTNIRAIKPYVKQDRKNKRSRDRRELQKIRYNLDYSDEAIFQPNKRDAWWNLT